MSIRSQKSSKLIVAAEYSSRDISQVDYPHAIRPLCLWCLLSASFPKRGALTIICPYFALMYANKSSLRGRYNRSNTDLGDGLVLVWPEKPRKWIVSHASLTFACSTEPRSRYIEPVEHWACEFCQQISCNSHRLASCTHLIIIMIRK